MERANRVEERNKKRRVEGEREDTYIKEEGPWKRKEGREGRSCWLYGRRTLGYIAAGDEGVGRGAADINNNYWFEPLSIRDLSNLKITSEINYVCLISPGPPIGIQTRVFYERAPHRSHVCASSL